MIILFLSKNGYNIPITNKKYLIMICNIKQNRIQYLTFVVLFAVFYIDTLFFFIYFIAYQLLRVSVLIICSRLPVLHLLSSSVHVCGISDSAKAWCKEGHFCNRHRKRLQIIWFQAIRIKLRINDCQICKKTIWNIISKCHQRQL